MVLNENFFKEVAFFKHFWLMRFQNMNLLFFYRDLKTDEKNLKATSPEQHNRANRRNSITEPFHLQTVPEQTNGDEQDAKE